MKQPGRDKGSILAKATVVSALLLFLLLLSGLLKAATADIDYLNGGSRFGTTPPAQNVGQAMELIPERM